MTKGAHQRSIAQAGIASVVTGLLLALVSATSISASAAPAPKVTICHATGSTSNPYVELTISQNVLDGAGASDHTIHTGPVFDFSNPAGNGGWGDIIPPFGTFSGGNWNEVGQDVHSRGCTVTTEAQPVTTEAQPVTTEVQPVTTEVQPVTTEAQPVTTEAQPVTTEVQPVTTEAQPVTTEAQRCTYNPQLTDDDPTCTPDVEGTATSAPPQASTTAQPTPSTEASVAPGLGASSDTTAGAVRGTSLPRTGRDIEPMVTVAAALVVLGLSLLLTQRGVLASGVTPAPAPRHLAPPSRGWRR